MTTMCEQIVVEVISVILLVQIRFRTTGPLDNCATGATLAVVADCSSSTPFSFDLASAGNLGTSFGTCDTTGTNTGGWFEFTTTAVENITINTTTAMKIEISDACGGAQVTCVNTARTSHIIRGLLPNTNYKLAMWVDGTSTATSDICIQEGPTCFKPTDLAANATGSDTAELSWMADGTNNTDYEIVVVAQGDPVTGTVVTTAVNVQSPFSVSGLTASTDYDFYVRANCGAGDLSSYSGPVSFTTSPSCGSTTFDSGGPNGDYARNELLVVTYYPDSAANVAQLEFLFVDLEVRNAANGTYWDNIIIYDGVDINAPAIGGPVVEVDVVGNGDQPIIYTATNPEGALTLEFDSDNSTNAGGFEVLFNCIVRPTCLPPSALAVDAVTNTTADLSWTAGTSMETIWDVEVVLAGDMPTGTPTDEDVANPYTKTGLTPGTRYEYYLRADCVNATSTYVGPLAFRTPGDGDTCDTSIDLTVATVCDATTQTIIDFDNALDLGSNVASCASNGTNLGAWYQFRPNRNTSAIFINASENVQYALFTTDAAGDCADVEIACGSLDSTAATEINQLNFRNFYKLVIWDDSGQLSSATICVENGPTCASLSDLDTVSFMANTADVTWTLGDPSQDFFNVSVYEAGADITDPAVVPVDVTTSTTNTATISNLVAAQSYDVYVQADCDVANPGTDVSSLLGPLTFDQPSAGEVCNIAIPVNVEVDCATATPLTVDFANLVDLGTDFASCDTFGVNTGVYLEFTAPAIGAVILNSTSAVRYVILESCGGSEVICGPSTTQSDVLGGLTPGASYIMALWKNGTSTATSDICITAAQGCLDPVNVELDNISDVTATFSWTPGDSSQTAFEIEITDDGVAQDPNNVVPVTGTSYTAMALTPDFSYDFYVRADCGNGDFSDWTSPLSFNTLCSAFTPDYIETFDTFTPDCWEQATNGSFAAGATGFGTSSWTADNFNNVTTNSDAVRINIFGTTLNDWAISPPFDLSVGGYEVVFNAAISNFNSSGPDPDGMDADDVVTLGYSSDGGTTWVSLFEITTANAPSNAGETFTVPVALTDSNVRFALHAVSTTSSSDYDFHVDNFQVRTTPTCVEVADLSVDDVSATTVTVSFNSGNTTSSGNFEYVVVPAGYSSPTGAGVAISDATVTNGSFSFVLGNGTHN